jgi:hypothetical protein
MTKLICPDCQHENEPERIYCHNCGARLDRTGLIKEKADEAVAEERTRQHLKKIFRPNRGRGKRIATKLGKTLLGALCLAVVIVMVLPPDLPPAPKAYTFAPLIGMDMMSAVSSHHAASLVYNEEQANSYLAATCGARTVRPNRVTSRSGVSSSSSRKVNAGSTSNAGYGNSRFFAAALIV